MKKKVFVTRPIPQAAMDKLFDAFDVTMNKEDRVLTKEELLAGVKGMDGVLCLLTDTINDEVFKAAGDQCKIFANYAVGYNNINTEDATNNGVIVTNTPGVLDEATSDLAWTLLFSASRRVVEADRFTRAGLYKGWGPLMYIGQDITNRTLGVVGSGRIGTAFAKKAVGFNMKVLYTDVKANPDFEAATGGTFVDKETLLKESDFVSLHVPLLPATTHYISTDELKMMKSSAVLINTSRGPVVDEAALVEALKNEDIFAAGLDVFEEEPLLCEGLADLNNVTILPHIASATIETRTNMGMIAVDNIISVLNGGAPNTCVNPEVL